MTQSKCLKAEIQQTLTLESKIVVLILSSQNKSSFSFSFQTQKLFCIIMVCNFTDQCELCGTRYLLLVLLPLKC